LKIVHIPLFYLTECLSLVYLQSLDVLEISSETAHDLALWVNLTLFEDPTF
jgi:hypothetical protein